MSNDITNRERTFKKLELIFMILIVYLLMKVINLKMEIDDEKII